MLEPTRVWRQRTSCRTLTLQKLRKLGSVQICILSILTDSTLKASYGVVISFQGVVTSLTNHKWCEIGSHIQPQCPSLESVLPIPYCVHSQPRWFSAEPGTENPGACGNSAQLNSWTQGNLPCFSTVFKLSQRFRSCEPGVRHNSLRITSAPAMILQQKHW